MMVQWHACKKLAKDAVLLFRLGDFYEAFYEDAGVLSRELDLTLTQRQGIPMSGIPCHASDPYIDKLVGRGFRIAVAEQMEDPKQVKGIVKREIVRIVTPGTLVNSTHLSEKKNNFFAAVTQVGATFGLAFLDLTTAEFRVIECAQERDLLNEIYRIRPAEFLCSDKFKERHKKLFHEASLTYSSLVNAQEEWHFDHQTTLDFLIQHFCVNTLDGFGLKGMVAAINAAGALLSYLQERLCLSIKHIKEIRPYCATEYLSLDGITQRNLELTESLHDGSKRNTLLDVLDRTGTPMGGRMLRQWVKQPLLSVKDIHKRQDAIEACVKHPLSARKIADHLSRVRDLERLMMKINTGCAGPRDLLALALSLDQIPPVKMFLEECPSELMHEASKHLEKLSVISQVINKALVDEPPIRVSDGNIFREGYHRELDELRGLCHDGKSWMAKYQTYIRDDLGVKTAKVGFNKIFGYYIEVSKGQATKMPELFQRRQTLVNTERFITPELKEYETKVLTAEDRLSVLESELFTSLRLEVIQYSEKVLNIARAVALIDCIVALAETARQGNYIRPIIDDSQRLEIKEGRHPVVEASLSGEKFVPNDTFLGHETNLEHDRLFVITGPNMAGKSTYIRQVALLVIMTQLGSFIPAISAHMGIVDKVFTRIGASDDVSRGQSTFMVEMTETANILHNATDRSLVVLDEIGRGTSTYDGISIAWAVAEYLLTTPGKRAKTLFATHYWELTKLEGRIPGAINYNVAVKEWNDDIIFLRKIIKGSTDRSYGIHVARLAGLPFAAINRAKAILIHLEDNTSRKELITEPGAFGKCLDRSLELSTNGKSRGAHQYSAQLMLFDPSEGLPKNFGLLTSMLKGIDVNHLTPLQAHAAIAELQRLL